MTSEAPAIPALILPPSDGPTIPALPKLPAAPATADRSLTWKQGNEALKLLAETYKAMLKMIDAKSRLPGAPALGGDPLFYEKQIAHFYGEDMAKLFLRVRALYYETEFPK